MSAKKAEPAQSEKKTRNRKVKITPAELRSEAADLMAMATAMRKAAEAMEGKQIASVEVDGFTMLGNSKRYVHRFISNVQRELF